MTALAGSCPNLQEKTTLRTRSLRSRWIHCLLPAADPSCTCLSEGVAPRRWQLPPVEEHTVTTAEHQWLKSQQTNNVDLLVPLLVTVLHTAIATGLFIVD